jgi:hypothetical protein
MDGAERAKGLLHALFEAKVVLAADAHDDARPGLVSIQLFDAVRVTKPFATITSLT